MERFSGSIPMGVAYPFANGIATSSNLQMIKGSPATSVLHFGVNQNSPRYPNSRNPSSNIIQVW